MNKAAKPATAENYAEELVASWVTADYDNALGKRSIDALIARVADVYRQQLARQPIALRRNGFVAYRDGRGIEIGTPREVSRTISGLTPGLRSPSCESYNLCLRKVVENGWENWTCNGCEGPGHLEYRMKIRTPVKK